MRRLGAESLEKQSKHTAALGEAVGLRDFVNVDADHRSPRPREALAMTSGSSKKVVAFTTAAARWAGLPDLKIPADEDAISSEFIIMAASAGVAMPPAVNSTTGSLPVEATSLTSSYGACSSFQQVDVELVLGQGGELQDLGADLAHVGGGVGDVAAGLALGADHGRAFVDAAQRFAGSWHRRRRER